MITRRNVFAGLHFCIVEYLITQGYLIITFHSLILDNEFTNHNPMVYVTPDFRPMLLDEGQHNHVKSIGMLPQQSVT